VSKGFPLCRIFHHKDNAAFLGFGGSNFIDPRHQLLVVGDGNGAQFWPFVVGENVGASGNCRGVGFCAFFNLDGHLTGRLATFDSYHLLEGGPLNFVQVKKDVRIFVLFVGNPFDFSFFILGLLLLHTENDEQDSASEFVRWGMRSSQSIGY
jgi:hypothetical protein